MRWEFLLGKVRRETAIRKDRSGYFALPSEKASAPIHIEGTVVWGARLIPAAKNYFLDGNAHSGQVFRELSWSGGFDRAVRNFLRWHFFAVSMQTRRRRADQRWNNPVFTVPGVS
jgi:hypothetical protein